MKNFAPTTVGEGSPDNYFKQHCQKYPGFKKSETGISVE